jgi:hypothetical protein
MEPDNNSTGKPNVPMKLPVLGVLRGRFLKRQRKLLQSLAVSNGLEMEIVELDEMGTDELIRSVAESGCQSVCFVNIANISRTFLFSLKFIYEVHKAGIDIFCVDTFAETPGFYQLDKEQYLALWNEFEADWDDIMQWNAIWRQTHQTPKNGSISTDDGL